MRLRVTNYFSNVIFCWISALPLFGQPDSLHREIRMLARPSMDSIVLRWAPSNVKSWLQSNKFGYTIERYTLVRNGKVVVPPERTDLVTSAMLPLPMSAWEPLVKRNKYAAIAAQALYGTTFELSKAPSDVFEIVNKAGENEQRFSFALVAADISPEVARALALSWVDRNVQKGERYLYRIRSTPTQPGADTLRGSVVVAAEKTDLLPPSGFFAEVKGAMVSLRWDNLFGQEVYTGFRVEKSADGVKFHALSDEPMVTLRLSKEDNRYQYATDSLAYSDSLFYYRVRGITPFGEWGPVSETVTVKAEKTVDIAPVITKGTSTNNQSVEIFWEFPKEVEDGLVGFDIRRAVAPTQPFMSIIGKPIEKNVRNYHDATPQRINYYQVIARAINGLEKKSPPFLVMLVDSLPPATPKKPTGTIDHIGRIELRWEANVEQDIYGYRVYRGNILQEEFTQVTREPVRQNSFQDSVSLKTLTKQIHYQVMAIDQSQNHSPLSEVLSLDLPDMVRPQPPVFRAPSATHEGPELRWVRSSSDDVVSYAIYRKARENMSWIRVGVVPANSDTLYSFIDRETPEGVAFHYTVIAIDEAHLESDPTTPVKASKLIETIKAPVQVEAEVDRTNKLVKISWRYNEPGVVKYQVYRAAEAESLRLFATITKGEFIDRHLVINTEYTYRVVAVFATGARSELSKALKVRY